MWERPSFVRGDFCLRSVTEIKATSYDWLMTSWIHSWRVARFFMESCIHRAVKAFPTVTASVLWGNFVMSDNKCPEGKSGPFISPRGTPLPRNVPLRQHDFGCYSRTAVHDFPSFSWSQLIAVYDIGTFLHAPNKSFCWQRLRRYHIANRLVQFACVSKVWVMDTWLTEHAPVWVTLWNTRGLSYHELLYKYIYLFIYLNSMSPESHWLTVWC